MTEKEKMLAGKLYWAEEPSLVAERMRAKDLCLEFNNTPPSHTEEGRAILLKLLGKTGRNFAVMSPFWCDYGYNIEIGENFFANHNCVILDCAKVKIGDNVFLAPDVGIYTAGHPIDTPRRNAAMEYAYPVTIGDNVWIGGGVRIVPGVTIGSNVVIGAGSVVTRDVPDNVVAAGTPCRVLRPVTPEDFTRSYDREV